MRALVPIISISILISCIIDPITLSLTLALAPTLTLALALAIALNLALALALDVAPVLALDIAPVAALTLANINDGSVICARFPRELS